MGVGMLVKRSMVAALAASAILTGCAGRDALPVSAYKPGDDRLTCGQIAGEIESNNQLMLARARESADTTDRNVMIGAAGVLLFVPILFAIDAKDAAGTENRAFEERNRVLTQKARMTGCQVPAAFTVAMVEETIGRQRIADSADPAAGKDAQTQDLATAAPVRRATEPQSASLPQNGGELRTLMNRFLRGEIDREEYERARTRIASN